MKLLRVFPSKVPCTALRIGLSAAVVILRALFRRLLSTPLSILVAAKSIHSFVLFSIHIITQVSATGIGLFPLLRSLLSTLMSILLAATGIGLFPLLRSLLSTLMSILLAATGIGLFPLLRSLLSTLMSILLAATRIGLFPLLRRLLSTLMGILLAATRFVLLPYRWCLQSPFLSIPLATLLINTCKIFCRLFGTPPTFPCTVSLCSLRRFSSGHSKCKGKGI